VKILHRLSWRPTSADAAELLALGFDPSAPTGLLTLVVDEADPRWPAVRSLAPDGVDIITTEATEAERAAAAWLVMLPATHQGYPQPEDGYAAATYESALWCEQCGAGAVQRAPFRLKRDPALRPGRILQLHWVYDEFFTAPETWATVFAPLGVGARPVVEHRSGTELTGVVQLDFGAEAPGPLALGDHQASDCPLCGRRKYAPFVRGFLPPLVGDLAGRHAVRTREVFGDGAKAFRHVLVSQQLYQAIRAHRVRGCGFQPTLIPGGAGAPAV
jgi:hypothetical protein